MSETANLAIPHIPDNVTAGHVVANQALDDLDDQLTGSQAIDCSAGGTIPVDAEAFRTRLRFVLEGAPAADFIVELPERRRRFLVHNTTGRAATLRITDSPGATVDLPDGAHILVYATGSAGRNLFEVSPQPAPTDVGTIYDFGFVIAQAPQAGEVLGRVRIGRDILIAADFDGSHGGVQDNPDGPYEIEVRADNVPVGALTISDAGALAWATIDNQPLEVDAGAEISFVAPDEDPMDESIGFGSFVIAARVR